MAASPTGTGGGSHEELLGALDVVFSFEAWDRLRRVRGCSAASTRRAMVYAATSLLSAGSRLSRTLSSGWAGIGPHARRSHAAK